MNLITDYVIKHYDNPRISIANFEIITGLDPNNFIWPANKIAAGSQISEYGYYRNVNSKYPFNIPTSESIKYQNSLLYPFPLQNNYSNWNDLIIYDGKGCKQVVSSPSGDIILNEIESTTYLLGSSELKKYDSTYLQNASSILGSNATNYYILPQILTSGLYSIRDINNTYYLSNNNDTCDSGTNYYVTFSTDIKYCYIEKNSDNTFSIFDNINKNNALYCKNFTTEINMLVYKKYNSVDNGFKFIIDNTHTFDGSFVITSLNGNVIQSLCSVNTHTCSESNDCGKLVATQHLQNESYYYNFNNIMRFNIIPSEISNLNIAVKDPYCDSDKIIVYEAHKPYTSLGDYGSRQIYSGSATSQKNILNFGNYDLYTTSEKVLTPIYAPVPSNWIEKYTQIMPEPYIYAIKYINKNNNIESSYTYGNIIIGRYIRIGFMNRTDSNPIILELSQIMVNSLNQNIILKNINKNNDSAYTDTTNGSHEEILISNISYYALDTYPGYVNYNKYVKCSITGSNPYFEIDLEENISIDSVNVINYGQNINGAQLEILSENRDQVFMSYPITGPYSNFYTWDKFDISCGLDHDNTIIPDKNMVTNIKTGINYPNCNIYGNKIILKINSGNFPAGLSSSLIVNIYDNNYNLLIDDNENIERTNNSYTITYTNKKYISSIIFINNSNITITSGLYCQVFNDTQLSYSSNIRNNNGEDNLTFTFDYSNNILSNYRFYLPEFNNILAPENHNADVCRYVRTKLIEEELHAITDLKIISYANINTYVNLGYIPMLTNLLSSPTYDIQDYLKLNLYMYGKTTLTTPNPTWILVVKYIKIN